MARSKAELVRLLEDSALRAKRVHDAAEALKAVSGEEVPIVSPTATAGPLERNLINGQVVRPGASRA